jgi:hypothetical protein
MIYESPDGGETVYAKHPGEDHTQRRLIREGPLQKRLRRSQLWREIFEAAETDPALSDMVKQVEAYHQLKNSP